MAKNTEPPQPPNPDRERALNQERKERLNESWHHPPRPIPPPPPPKEKKP